MFSWRLLDPAGPRLLASAPRSLIATTPVFMDEAQTKLWLLGGRQAEPLYTGEDQERRLYCTYLIDPLKPVLGGIVNLSTFMEPLMVQKLALEA